MADKGLLIVVSGPSGAGKGTVCKRLFELDDNLVSSVSVTTRAPRPGEKEGINYFFRTQEEFDQMMEAGELLENAHIFGNSYGTPRRFVYEHLREGRDVLLEIDIQGALAVKERFDEGVFIFIVPPSMKELKNRITGRGTETPDVILERFRHAYEEMNFITRYNYVVINDKVDAAVEKVRAILTAEKCRVDRNRELNRRLIEEAYEYDVSPLNELLEKAECRYSLVVEVSKRARQLVEGAARLTSYESDKPVTIAVHEVFEGKIKAERPAPTAETAAKPEE